jgi:hypothetical protein
MEDEWIRGTACGQNGFLLVSTISCRLNKEVEIIHFLDYCSCASVNGFCGEDFVNFSVLVA